MIKPCIISLGGFNISHEGFNKCIKCWIWKIAHEKDDVIVTCHSHITE